MTNRREFIQTGMAVTAAASVAGPSAQAAMPAPAPAAHRIHKVIYDGRFDEPVRFAMIDRLPHWLQSD